MARLEFEAIGTHWQIDLPAVLTVPEQASVQADIRKTIADYDQLYSRFRSDSIVQRLAQQAGSYHLPSHATELFQLYHQLYQLTDGAFTPLIGSTLEQAGYDADYSLQPKTLTRPQSWEEVIQFQDNELTLTHPALLDFGAGGKGQLVDLVSAVIEQAGITDYCVDAGGDLRQRTSQAEPLRVGLEHPQQLAQAIGIVALKNQSLCGSAGNRRQWGKYHHIINPQTLTSPTKIMATWVVADTTLLADAVATALFFVPPEQLYAVGQFEYLVVDQQLHAQKSAQFPGELFTA